MFYKSVAFKEDASYIFEASRANSLRLKLFSSQDYERLVDNDLEFIYSSLNERSYDTGERSPELLLDKAQRTLQEQILSFAQGKEALRLYFQLPRDFFNLKVLHKGWLKEEKFENLKFLDQGTVTQEKLKKLFDGEEAGVLHPVLSAALKRFSSDIDDRTPFTVDILWDRYLHEFYLAQARLLDSDFLFKVHSLKVDLLNILNLFRLKTFDKDYKTYQKVFISGGQLSLYVLSDLYKEDMDIIAAKLSYLDYASQIKKGVDFYRKNENLSEMEKELDEFFYRFLNQGANKIFGFEVLFTYYWLKQNEINNLRLIFAAKLNDIERDWILGRLRV